jgi:hypothetical protein
VPPKDGPLTCRRRLEQRLRLKLRHTAEFVPVRPRLGSSH